MMRLITVLCVALPAKVRLTVFNGKVVYER